MNERFEKLVTDSLTRIEDRQDKIELHLAEIDGTLKRQEDQLGYHIKRTDTLEDKVVPITEGYHQMVGVMKLVGFLAVVASIGEAISIIFLHSPL